MLFILITFHDGGLYHIETSPLFCSANLSTGFYMTVTSVTERINLSGRGVSGSRFWILERWKLVEWILFNKIKSIKLLLYLCNLLLPLQSKTIRLRCLIGFWIHVWRPLCNTVCFNPLKRQPHKMVKHTQTIRRKSDDELFERVWPFLGVGAWSVKYLNNRVVSEKTLAFLAHGSLEQQVYLSIYQKWKSKLPLTIHN